MLGKPFLAVVTGLTLCLGVACSGDADAPDAATSSTPSATGSATGSLAPSPPTEPSTTSADPTPPAAPRAANSRAGRRAFATYVAQLWGFAIRTNDAGPLLSLSPKGRPCGGCRRLRAELAKREAEGWYVDFPGVRVRSVGLSGNRRPTVATMAVSIPESEVYNRDGSFRSTSPADPRASFEVRMLFARGKYRLLSFTVTG